MREVTFAAVQYACGAPGSLGTAERLVREAAEAGAAVVVLPALFETPYFCKTQEEKLLGLARPVEENGVVDRFAQLASELGVVLTISLYEADGPVAYASAVMIDADGAVLGTHRQAHVPQRPGRAERFYFAPGGGFRAWDTAHGRFGIGLGHDARFPEAARAMALMGAEALLFPVAEVDASFGTILAGHALANAVPVVAANRTGFEAQRDVEATFPGGSAILGAGGERLADVGADEGIALAAIDLDEARDLRRASGLFGDRRPDLYGRLARI